MPASAAISSASSDGQTQSPGYQPSCRRQARPSRGTRPLASTGSRRPHSRQYSWFGSCGVPQRGQSGRPAPCGSPTGASPFPGGEALTAYSSQRSGFGLPSPAPTPACLITVASASRSPSPLAGASAAFPQLGQNPASAGSGWSHCVQVTTACSPTGRPQFAQKWEPQMIGAPQSQRLAVVRRPAAARSEEHTSELQSLTNLVCRLLLEKKK